MWHANGMPHLPLGCVNSATLYSSLLPRIIPIPRSGREIYSAILHGFAFSIFSLQHCALLESKDVMRGSREQMSGPDQFGNEPAEPIPRLSGLE